VIGRVAETQSDASPSAGGAHQRPQHSVWKGKCNEYSDARRNQRICSKLIQPDRNRSANDQHHWVGEEPAGDLPPADVISGSEPSWPRAHEAMMRAAAPFCKLAAVRPERECCRDFALRW
jgi:hypothetical protein